MANKSDNKPSYRSTVLQEYLRDMSARELGAHFRDEVAFAKARFCSWGPNAQASAIAAGVVMWPLERLKKLRDWLSALIDQMEGGA